MLFIFWLSKPCPRPVGRGPSDATAHASGFPSPCLGLSSKRPWPPDCGRFSFRSVDHGGQIICLVSVGQDRPILTRSGSGDPELLRLILIQTTEGSRGTGPRATVAAAFFFAEKR